MRLRTAKTICYAVHYGRNKILNWSPETIRKMERHRKKYNSRQNKINDPIVSYLNSIPSAEPITKELFDEYMTRLEQSMGLK